MKEQHLIYVDDHFLQQLSVDPLNALIWDSTRKILRCRNDQADAVAETILAFVKSKGKIILMNSGFCEAYIWAIAKYKALQVLENRSRLRTNMRRFYKRAVPKSIRSPLVELESAERIQRVKEAIGSLPSRYQEVINLLDEASSSEECAKKMSVKIATWYKLAARARKALFEKLDLDRDED